VALDAFARVDEDDLALELEAAEAFYRRRLTAPAVVEEHQWAPTAIGPTWHRDGDFWALPERSLGWLMLAWCGAFLQAGRDEPWIFTDEQARFLLWWYAVDESGRFLYRDGVLQRLKGHGKDPIGCCIALFEMVGPCVPTMRGGELVGVEHPDPWVQIAAVSLEQTKNTTRLLPTLVSPRLIEETGLSIGKESAYAGNRFLQAVTSSPATLQGARATFVLLNETRTAATTWPMSCRTTPRSPREARLARCGSRTPSSRGLIRSRSMTVRRGRTFKLAALRTLGCSTTRSRRPQPLR
jgi:hypothetical protein